MVVLNQSQACQRCSSDCISVKKEQKRVTAGKHYDNVQGGIVSLFLCLDIWRF